MRPWIRWWPCSNAISTPSDDGRSDRSARDRRQRGSGGRTAGDRGPTPTAPADEPPTTDAAAASATVRDTLAAVASSLSAKAEKADAHAKPILEAGAMMAQDPGLAGAIDTHLQAGKGITNAVAAAVEEYCAMFESIGGYMAERVTDLRDVRDRTVARLLGKPEPGVPSLETPSVLAAVDLAPAETATLNVETCLGIITSAGGPTSHTAILAAQLGIPAIVQAVGILDVPAGTTIALDGGVGRSSSTRPRPIRPTWPNARPAVSGRWRSVRARG